MRAVARLPIESEPTTPFVPPPLAPSFTLLLPLAVVRGRGCIALRARLVHFRERFLLCLCSSGGGGGDGIAGYGALP